MTDTFSWGLSPPASSPSLPSPWQARHRPDPAGGTISSNMMKTSSIWQIPRLVSINVKVNVTWWESKIFALISLFSSAISFSRPFITWIRKKQRMKIDKRRDENQKEKFINWENENRKIERLKKCPHLDYNLQPVLFSLKQSVGFRYWLSEQNIFLLLPFVGSLEY